MGFVNCFCVQVQTTANDRGLQRDFVGVNCCYRIGKEGWIQDFPKGGGGGGGGGC